MLFRHLPQLYNSALRLAEVLEAAGYLTEVEKHKGSVGVTKAGDLKVRARVILYAQKDSHERFFVFLPNYLPPKTAHEYSGLDWTWRALRLSNKERCAGWRRSAGSMDTQ
jgi:hypothetical protein